MAAKVKSKPKSKAVDPIELEEKYHDADGMCAVSVIDYEISQL
jgi:hypothetical protein